MTCFFLSAQFLVDLAGTECVKKSGVRGQGAEEAGKINKSLLALEKVVRCLDAASRGYVILFSAVFVVSFNVSWFVSVISNVRLVLSH